MSILVFVHCFFDCLGAQFTRCCCLAEPRRILWGLLIDSTLSVHSLVVAVMFDIRYFPFLDDFFRTFRGASFS